MIRCEGWRLEVKAALDAAEAAQMEAELLSSRTSGGSCADATTSATNVAFTAHVRTCARVQNMASSPCGAPTWPTAIVKTPSKSHVTFALSGGP